VKDVLPIQPCSTPDETAANSSRVDCASDQRLLALSITMAGIYVDRDDANCRS